MAENLHQSQEGSERLEQQLGGDLKKKKLELLLLIQSLDKRAETQDLASHEWEQRYAWEEDLVGIYSMEEVMWQTRGGEKWLLEGDANTGYFHGVANGRKRKCFIRSLEEDGILITETQALQQHITDFYKHLFHSGPQSKLKLHPELWGTCSRISEEENIELTRPFSIEE